MPSRLSSPPVMLPSWFSHLTPSAWRFHRAVAAHRAGHVPGRFTPMPAEAPPMPAREPLRIHVWTPRLLPSAFIHVGHVLPQLRAQAAAMGCPWQITSGTRLPEGAVDWLLCLKAVPPEAGCPVGRTVLLVNDDAHRIWGRLGRFGHVVSVSSPVLASLLGAVHPRAWFVEETEPPEQIEQGGRALEQGPPSARPSLLMWHGMRGSLDGLRGLRPVLEAFARETGVELAVVTDLPAGTERWGSLRVRYVPWSAGALAATAAQARAGIVPARPTVADSYLKSGGRQRCLFALGCPAMGDARSPDVSVFSEACGAPASRTRDEWLAALRQLWRDPARLDEIARRGHALVRDRYSATRTAAQWLWFFSGGAEGRL